MTIGRIKTSKAVENGQFAGVDITAEFYDAKGRVSEVSFRYAKSTNNFQGLVEKGLSAYFAQKPTPEHFSNFQIS